MQQPPTSHPSPNTPTATTQPRKAAHPFDKPGADLILRTSDLVDFHVRRDILIEASPVFESILSIPQPKSDRATLPDDRPIIDLTEDHKTLDILLRICYPIVKPDLSGGSPQELESAVKAALKYEMAFPLDTLTTELCAMAARHPLEAWAVACRTGLEHVARTAVLHLPKARPLEVECLGRMEGISAGNYYRLVEFRLDGGTTLDPLLSPPANLESSPGSAPPHPTYAFHTDIPFPDLVCYSADDVPFSVHKGLLSAASPVLERTIREAGTPATNVISDGVNGSPVDYSESPSPPGSTYLPILRIFERSDVLSVLLRFCYPGFTKLPSDPSHFASILVAVNKYEMRAVTDYIHSQWDAVARSRPLPAYLAAARVGLRTCAIEAARYVVRDSLEGVYVPEMEDTPALAYHHLRTYYASCQIIAERLLAALLVNDTVIDGTPTLPESDVYGSSNPRIAKIRPVPSPWGAHYRAQQLAQPYHDSKPFCSSNSWLQMHIKELLAKAKAHPANLPSTPSVFEAATTAGQWCKSCRIFAAEISKVEATLRDIPLKIEELSIGC